MCIKSQLSVFMIAGSYYGFLLNAAMCGGHREIFSYVSTAGTLQEGSHVGTGWTCEHLCTRRVSLRYHHWYRFGTGETLEKKEQFRSQRKHK